MTEASEGRGRRLLLVGLAGLLLVGLALGAASFGHQPTPAAGEGGPDREDEADSGLFPNRTTAPANESSVENPSPLAPTDYVFVLTVLAVAILIGLVTMDPRRVLIGLVLIGVFALLVWLVPSLDLPGDILGSGGEFGLQPDADGGGSGEAGSQGVPAPTTVPTLLLLAIGLAGGLLTVYTYARTVQPTETEDDDEVEEEPAAVSPEAAALGRAAGEAADRLAEESLENVVYDAWRDMTAVVDVPDPEVATPAEFRQAAIEAGLPPDAVDTLTEEFRAVRYGAEPTTADREAAARAALREIEAATPEESGDADG